MYSTVSVPPPFTATPIDSLAVPAIRLEGKTALVTGASSGFGKVIAKALQDEGVKVAVGARRVDRLEGDFAHVLDVTDPESSAEFVTAAVEALGGLDFLINNAGGAIGRYPFWESSEDDEEWMGHGVPPWKDQHAMKRSGRAIAA